MEWNGTGNNFADNEAQTGSEHCEKVLHRQGARNRAFKPSSCLVVAVISEETEDRVRQYQP